VNTTIKRVLFGIVALYLVFQVFVFKADKQSRFHEKIIVALVGPFQSGAKSILDGISRVGSSYVFLTHQKKELERLNKELSKWRQDKILAKETSLENQRLKKMLSIQVSLPFKRVIAKRIASGSSRFEQSIRIQKGERHGIREGLPVLNADGILGQVIKVYWDHSDVLLITDPTSSIDVIVQRSRDNAILKGTSKNRLSFEYLDKSADLLVDDVVIASGLDGIYPKGFPVGRVDAIGQKNMSLFLKASVRPYVAFGEIEEVVVLIPGQQNRIIP